MASSTSGDIDTARAAGDWKTAERALKSWSAAGSTTGFDSPAHASAYAATVRAEVAMHARRLSDARSLALEALDAVPHFADALALLAELSHIEHRAITASISRRSKSRGDLMAAEAASTKPTTDGSSGEHLRRPSVVAPLGHMMTRTSSNMRDSDDNDVDSPALRSSVRGVASREILSLQGVNAATITPHRLYLVLKGLWLLVEHCRKKKDMQAELTACQRLWLLASDYAMSNEYALDAAESASTSALLAKSQALAMLDCLVVTRLPARCFGFVINCVTDLPLLLDRCGFIQESISAYRRALMPVIKSKVSAAKTRMLLEGLARTLTRTSPALHPAWKPSTKLHTPDTATEEAVLCCHLSLSMGITGNHGSAGPPKSAHTGAGGTAGAGNAAAAGADATTTLPPAPTQLPERASTAVKAVQDLDARNTLVLQFARVSAVSDVVQALEDTILAHGGGGSWFDWARLALALSAQHPTAERGRAVIRALEEALRVRKVQVEAVKAAVRPTRAPNSGSEEPEAVAEAAAAEEAKRAAAEMQLRCRLIPQSALLSLAAKTCHSTLRKHEDAIAYAEAAVTAAREENNSRALSRCLELLGVMHEAWAREVDSDAVRQRLRQGAEESLTRAVAVRLDFEAAESLRQYQLGLPAVPGPVRGRRAQSDATVGTDDGLSSPGRRSSLANRRARLRSYGSSSDATQQAVEPRPPRPPPQAGHASDTPQPPTLQTFQSGMAQVEAGEVGSAAQEASVGPGASAAGDESVADAGAGVSVSGAVDNESDDGSLDGSDHSVGIVGPPTCRDWRLCYHYALCHAATLRSIEVAKRMAVQAVSLNPECCSAWELVALLTSCSSGRVQTSHVVDAALQLHPQDVGLLFVEAALQLEVDPTIALDVFAQISDTLGYEAAPAQEDVGSTVVPDVASHGVINVANVQGPLVEDLWVEVGVSSETVRNAPRQDDSAQLGVLADGRLRVGPASGFHKSMRLWFEFGVAALAAGRQHDAFACLKNADAVASAAGDPRPRALSIHLAGMLHESSGDRVMAEAQYAAALGVHASHARSMIRLAALALQAARDAEADTAELHKARHAASATTGSGIGGSGNAAGTGSRAAPSAAAEAAAVLAPTDVPGHTASNVLRERRKGHQRRHSRADTDDGAFSDYASEPAAHDGLAPPRLAPSPMVSHDMREHLDRAEQLLQRALQADAGSYHAWHVLGQVRAARGHHVTAAEAVLTALELESSSPLIPFVEVPVLL